MTNAADMIIENGRVLTMDPARTRAEAVAVAGGRIMAVGEPGRHSPGFAVAGTLVIDAGGGSVLPGFIESHVHLFIGGAELDSLSLAGLAGFDRIAEAIRERRGKIRGRRRDPARRSRRPIRCSASRSPGNCSTASCPTGRWRFSRATITRCGRTRRRCSAAGILHGRATPAGSEVVMGADGLATGELREFESFAPCSRLAPTGGREMLGLLGREPETPPTAAQRAVDRDIAAARACPLRVARHHQHPQHGRQFLPAGAARRDRRRRGAARALQDPVPRPAGHGARPIRRGRRAPGALELRPAEGGFRQALHGRGDRIVDRLHARRLFRTRRASRGSAFFEPDEFDAICVEAERLGFQIAVHAIGDAAVRRTLDGYEAARRRQRRPRHPAPDRAYRDARPGRPAALRRAWRHCLDAADACAGRRLPDRADRSRCSAAGGMMTAYAWQTLCATPARGWSSPATGRSRRSIRSSASGPP